MKTTSRLLTTSLLFLSVSLATPNARAVVPPPDGGYPGGNTAEGQNALFSLTTGGYNSAVGFLSLRSTGTGSFNTAIGAGTLLANIADGNTATGAGALLSNTTGTFNTANGAFALFSNTTNGGNTATGARALFSNSTGFNNTADGAFALFTNSTGGANTALGANALANNTQGGNNTAVGASALASNTGGLNIAIGFLAGLNLTTGNHNIDISNLGVAGESNTIRIGDTGHTATYVAGIAGQTVGAGGTTCYVDNDGKLGVMLSARRYKENIQRMEETSAALFSLKPVTFRYKPEFDKSGTPHFGLIAEEVAEVSPDLVVRNAKGELSTVRYEAINVMLLNEFLKAHRKLQELEAKFARLQDNFEEAGAKQRAQIQVLTARLDEQDEKLEATVATLAAQLQKVTAQVEISGPAMRFAAENP